jgi:hypothetical protein
MTPGDLVFVTSGALLYAQISDLRLVQSLENASFVDKGVALPIPASFGRQDRMAAHSVRLTVVLGQTEKMRENNT